MTKVTVYNIGGISNAAAKDETEGTGDNCVHTATSFGL